MDKKQYKKYCIRLLLEEDQLIREIMDKRKWSAAKAIQQIVKTVLHSSDVKVFLR